MKIFVYVEMCGFGAHEFVVYVNKMYVNEGHVIEVYVFVVYLIKVYVLIVYILETCSHKLYVFGTYGFQIY